MTAVNRLLYVCLDGLADDPIPELDGRTPLEAAETPFLDALARRGSTGTVTTVGEGIAPESDIAVFAILGYDPREEHPGPRASWRRSASGWTSATAISPTA